MNIFSLPVLLASLASSPAISGFGCITPGSTPEACEAVAAQADAAEDKLNKTYQRLIAKLASASKKGDGTLFADARADLDAAQRAWVIFRQKDCDSRAYNYRDIRFLSGRFLSSGKILSDRDTCSLMRTKQRTVELQEMLDDLRSLDSL
jgi:uncharacterized protein YecT (DUF1311 family)